MKRFAPFLIIAFVAALTLWLGQTLLRMNARTLPERATNPSSTGRVGSEFAHSRGPDHAPVILEEFGDFQCPACAQTSAVIRKIEQEYGDRLRLEFCQFPLAMHQHAHEAALAAEAASLQGHFWEMHDLLYQHQSSWANSPDVLSDFERFALELHLNITRFRQDMLGAATAARVDAEQASGVSRGVKNTPTLIINGQEFPPPFTSERLRAAIEDALAKKNKT